MTTGFEPDIAAMLAEGTLGYGEVLTGLAAAFVATVVLSALDSRSLLVLAGGGVFLALGNGLI